MAEIRSGFIVVGDKRVLFRRIACVGEKDKVKNECLSRKTSSFPSFHTAALQFKHAQEMPRNKHLAAALFVAVITVILLIFYAIMIFLATPSDDEIKSLTNAYPQETLTRYALANVFFEHVEISDSFDRFFSAIIGRFFTSAWQKTTKQVLGGMWVGGRLFQTSHRLIFMPNSGNLLAHKHLGPLYMDLDSVIDVVDQWGLITPIGEVKSLHRAIKFRCFSAKEFTAAIREHVRSRKDKLMKDQ